MNFIDVKAIKARINTDADYKAMYETMAAEVVSFHSTFEDDPSKMSRWGHHYFCKEDGSALTYDPKSPTVHVCPLCKTEYKSDLFDGVWIYQYRNHAAVALMKAAVVYKITGEQKYLDIYEEILSFYALNYESFKLHNKEGLEFDTIEEMKWGCGRIMPQGLNEAIILNRILFSMTILKDDVQATILEQFKTKFIPSVFGLLKAQVVQIHNISCWMNSTIGSMGLFAENQEMIDFAFKGEFNIGRQLREGVTDDNFWYEGSIHYNFFTLEGLTSLALFAKTFNYDFGPELKIVENMLLTAYEYAFDTLRLPNPNDGWPDVNLKTYSYIYSIGTKVFGYESGVGQLLNCILSADGERGPVPLSKPYYYENRLSYERFILLPDFKIGECTLPKAKSVKFEHSNFAVLKNDRVNLFYKYGHNGKSHAHPDKMTIEVTLDGELLAKDLSNAGYGSTICNEWHRVTASHNTIVVDGQDQTNTEPGTVLEFNDNFVDAKAENVFEDVTYNRTLAIQENGFEDTFKVSSEKERTYDFIFHASGKALTEVETVPAELGYTKNGYQHMTDVRKLVTSEDTLTLRWSINNHEFEWLMDIKDSEVFFTKTPDNPISHWRNTVIIRKVGKEASFKQQWRS